MKYPQTTLTLPEGPQVVRERKGGLASRFWRHVDKSGECWLWTAGRFDTGYGAVWYQGRVHKAHRIAWLLTHGALPEGLLLHTCDRPPCVNPEHLHEGTHRDNTAEMDARGRRTHRHPKAKLTADQVQEIRRLRELGLTYKAIGSSFGVTWAAIWKITHGQSWRHLAPRAEPQDGAA